MKAMLGTSCIAISFLCQPAMAKNLSEQALYRMTQKGSVQCLASAVQYEANTESTKGKKAVAAVIVNRSIEQGKHVCDIIRQPKQFSWYRKGKIGVNVHKDNVEVVKKLIAVAVNNRYNHLNHLSHYTYFYNHKQVKPVWAKKMKCELLGNHTFCKERK